ncbi:MAG: exodeoxyribonuclease V subunit alpha [Myxococcota bacterium]|nr:exodeoxyribonuclease V subunit alpha [Myxococcota bacterium]
MSAARTSERQDRSLSATLQSLLEMKLIDAAGLALAQSVARLDLRRRQPALQAALTLQRVGLIGAPTSDTEDLPSGADTLAFGMDDAEALAQLDPWVGSGLLAQLAALAHSAYRMGHTRLPLTASAIELIFAEERLAAREERRLSDLLREQKRQAMEEGASSQGEQFSAADFSGEAEERLDADDDERARRAQALKTLAKKMSRSLDAIREASGALLQSAEVILEDQDAPAPPLVFSLADRAHPWVATGRAWAEERECQAILTRLTEIPARIPSGGELSEAAAIELVRRRMGGIDERGYFDQGEPRRQLAALSAITHPLSLVHGGPGTGKSALAQRVLAILVELYQETGAQRPLRVALTAPTGKAAVRLRESIERRPDFYTLDDTVWGQLELLQLEGETLHRLLKFHPDRPSSARYHPTKPLPIDVLIVDEASMIELPLFRGLLRALDQRWGEDEGRSFQRLILLGDPDQLPPVGGGAVWRDLCRESLDGVSLPLPGQPWCPAPAFQALTKTVLGQEKLPESLQNAVRDCSVELAKNHRLSGGDNAAARLKSVSDLVQRGEVAALLSLLRREGAETNSPIEWIALEHFESLQEAKRSRRRFVDVPTQARYQSWYKSRRTRAKGLRTKIAAHHAWLSSDPLKSSDEVRVALQALYTTFSKELTLCAHYRGPFGVLGYNGALSHLGRDETHHAHPILILSNQHRNQLFNGDIGFLYERPTGSARARGDAVAYFEGRGEGIGQHQLPLYDQVYAMSIHKSQGSEFEEVTLTLPPYPSALLTRELLYTAITRSKRKVRIVASEAALIAAVERKSQRFTLAPLIHTHREKS